ncbi:MAG: murein L,D-transpeptidase catalytic domain family protein [Bacteroidetes bacterium]|nr:murein L,D-transpeptidase catalytic domain family protein [Bacteroidota bacterium]
MIYGILVFTITVMGVVYARSHATDHVLNTYDYQRVADKYDKHESALEAQHLTDSLHEWLEENGYSTSLLFIADMGLRMNIKRFYAINPDSKKLIFDAIVSHGSGGKSTIQKATFSNVSGSFCTSKGRFKIGEKYTGKFGKSYRLHGLDASNSNALERCIVLHAYMDQTEDEYENPLYFSAGCPMLGQESFSKCDSLIQKEDKPVMLIITE